MLFALFVTVGVAAGSDFAAGKAFSRNRTCRVHGLYGFILRPKLHGSAAFGTGIGVQEGIVRVEGPLEYYTILPRLSHRDG